MWFGFAASIIYIGIIRAGKQSRKARSWMISQLRGEEDN